MDREEKGGGGGCPTYNVVAVCSEFRDTVHAAPSVWWPVVGREETKNISQGDLVFDDLVVFLLLGNGIHVFMAPGVSGDLMPFGKHASEGVRLPGAGLIEGTFGPVHTGDEKGGTGSIPTQDVKKLVGVVIRAVIESDRHGAGDTAGSNVDTVQNIAEMRSRSVGSVGSLRDDVPMTCRAVTELAPWSCAVCTPSSAKPLHTKG